MYVDFSYKTRFFISLTNTGSIRELGTNVFPNYSIAHEDPFSPLDITVHHSDGAM